MPRLYGLAFRDGQSLGLVIALKRRGCCPYREVDGTLQGQDEGLRRVKDEERRK